MARARSISPQRRDDRRERDRREGGHRDRDRDRDRARDPAPRHRSRSRERDRAGPAASHKPRSRSRERELAPRKRERSREPRDGRDKERVRDRDRDSKKVRRSRSRERDGSKRSRSRSCEQPSRQNGSATRPEVPRSAQEELVEAPLQAAPKVEVSTDLSKFNTFASIWSMHSSSKQVCIADAGGVCAATFIGGSVETEAGGARCSHQGEDHLTSRAMDTSLLTASFQVHSKSVLLPAAQIPVKEAAGGVGSETQAG